MTENEKKIIESFAVNKITKDEFHLRFPFGKEAKSYIINSLNQAYDCKNADDVEYTLLLYFNLNNFKFDKSNTGLLGNLLLEKWHNCHEDLAMSLQSIGDPQSIPFLEKAMYLNLEYLDYNDGESLIRKCAYAIADVDTEESLKKLQELSESENPIIRSCAIEQLQRKSTNLPQ
ncbi:HEAT repeat domain-containing protein [Ulvibacterium marinum]|uniref:HEAT repeat domain-containing protein n=1 Tax=Ulvibacterium marinum TaxID=2419782 RepID=UPI002494D097|nr:HEAT repeat domain-containing protein [Ulvibacterium marinum]